MGKKVKDKQLLIKPIMKRKTKRTGRASPWKNKKSIFKKS
jgi:hypothetical protein